MGFWHVGVAHSLVTVCCWGEFITGSWHLFIPVDVGECGCGSRLLLLSDCSCGSRLLLLVVVDDCGRCSLRLNKDCQVRGDCGGDCCWYCCCDSMLVAVLAGMKSLYVVVVSCNIL